MSDIFQISSVGMLDGQQRLEAISQNTAANGMPGYRRHVAVDPAFETLIGGAATANDAPAALRVNLRAAARQMTGRALDVSIDQDDQFFGLTDGEHVWLTRDGAFTLSAQGVLVGQGGLRVVGTQGDIHLPGSDVTIRADGRITHAGETLGALQMFRATDPAGLRAAQGALLSAPGGTLPTLDGRVQGGMLESSNTDSALEMLDAMSVSRQFEAMSRVVQSYDEALGQAIDKLGGL